MGFKCYNLSLHALLGTEAQQHALYSGTPTTLKDGHVRVSLFQGAVLHVIVQSTRLTRNVLMTLAKWLHPPRLETRTKESNIYASL